MQYRLYQPKTACINLKQPVLAVIEGFFQDLDSYWPVFGFWKISYFM
jgi:hypothetical protein